MQRPPDIQTERLRLIVVLPDEIEALMVGDVRPVEVANGIIYPPDDPNRGVDFVWHLTALRGDNNQLPWRIRIIVKRSSNTAIGSINLKGPPDEFGDVEIGWGLNEEARGKGYATEAAAAVMQWAFQQRGVRCVSATIPDDNAVSRAVARRLGMSPTAATRRNRPLWKCAKSDAAGGG